MIILKPANSDSPEKSNTTVHHQNTRETETELQQKSVDNTETI